MDHFCVIHNFKCHTFLMPLKCDTMFLNVVIFKPMEVVIVGVITV